MRSYYTFLVNNWPLLGFGFTAVFWGNFGQSFFIAWFGADIQRSLGLSAGAYGGAYAAATLASALCVIWLGALIDRLSLRSYAVGVASGLALACVLLAQAGGIVSLLLGFFLLRLFGQSLLPHTGITTMARCFQQARGKAISVAMSGVPAGEVVLPLLAVALIAGVGWQTTFLLIAVAVPLLLIPALLLFLRQSDYDRTHGHAKQAVSGSVAGTAPTPAGRREVLRDYRYWLALPALLAIPFLITGIFIHQNFIVFSKGWTLGWLASCFVVYGLVHWFSSLIAGAMVDRYKATHLLPFFLMPMLAALLVLAFVPGWWSALLMMTLLGLAAGSSPPITSSLWAEVYGTRRLGSIRSMNMAIVVTSTAASPVLFGYLIDQGTSVATLFGFSALYVLIAIVLIACSYTANPRPVFAA